MQIFMNNDIPYFTDIARANNGFAILGVLVEQGIFL